jgi:hypothetical protein
MKTRGDSPITRVPLVVSPRGRVTRLETALVDFGKGAGFFFNIREFRQDADGDWRASPKRGLGIQLRELPDLCQAIILAAEKALAAGIEDDELAQQLRRLAALRTRRLDATHCQPELAPAEAESGDSQSRLDTDSVRHEGLDTRVGQAKLDTDEPINLYGWSIQRDKRGFYRAFRKINGRTRCLYIGKSVENAADKLRAENQKYCTEGGLCKVPF